MSVPEEHGRDIPNLPEQDQEGYGTIPGDDLPTYDDLTAASGPNSRSVARAASKS